MSSVECGGNEGFRPAAAAAAAADDTIPPRTVPTRN